MIAILRNSIEKTKLNRFFILMKFTLYKTTLSTSKLIRQGENFTYKQQMMLRLFVNLGGFLKLTRAQRGSQGRLKLLSRKAERFLTLKMGLACTSYTFTSLHPALAPQHLTMLWREKNLVFAKITPLKLQPSCNLHILG